MLVPTFRDPHRTVVVAHDAGAANLLFAWLAPQEHAFRMCLSGPALELWHTRTGLRHQWILNEALEGAACLLSGTGWSSDVEHRARLLASEMHIPSIAVLDHWVNYKDRFVRDDVERLPDRLWVSDDHAHALAQRLFPGVPIENYGNVYVAEQVAAAGPVPDHGDLVFLCEPARSCWGSDVPGEFQSMDFLLSGMDALGIRNTPSIRVRPHPSDPPGKYKDWIAQHDMARLDTSPDLAGALRNARYVAGMNSAALQIALASGRETICALPPNAPPCVLPFSGLIHLRDRLPRGQFS